MNTRPVRQPPSGVVSETELRRRIGQAQAAVAAGQMEKALGLLDLEVLAAVDRLPVSEGVDTALALAGRVPPGPASGSGRALLPPSP